MKIIVCILLAIALTGCATRMPEGFKEPVEAPLMIVVSCPPLYDNRVSPELYNQCRSAVMQHLEKPAKAPGFGPVNPLSF